MRRRVGFALTAVGLLLATIAVVAGSPDATSGAAETVESALRPVPNSAAAPTTSQAAPTETAPQPLWEPNSPEPVEQAAPLPTALRIERLGVQAPIVAHGVETNGQMSVPSNATEVAWYRYGPSPGQPGSAVLAAHVDLEGQGPGVFFRLDELAPGDLVQVGFEDGTTGSFEVVARTIYPKSQLPLDVIFSREGAPVLTLVTCGGAFDSSTRRYDSNVVVYAAPVEEAATPASAG